MSDTKGYGSHGDYVFGWKGDALQRAMNSSCMFQACGANSGGSLKVQTLALFNECKIKNTVTEDTGGCKFSCV
jgi:hypothetical protein